MMNDECRNRFVVHHSAFIVSRSVRQRIKDVVDAKFISALSIFRRQWLEGMARPLPVITLVVVVVDYHHQPAVLVLQAEKHRLASIVRRPHVKRLDRKETIEDRMSDIERLHLILGLWKRPLNVVFEVAHLP